MISSSEIHEIVKKYKSQCEKEEYSDSKKKEAIELRKAEKDILSSKAVSNFPISEINKFYSLINSNKITEYNEYNNYDIGLMDVALSGCSKIYLSAFPGSLENNERVMEWVRGMRHLTSQIPNEVSFASKITQMRQYFYGMDTFQIKAPRLCQDDSDKVSPERLDCLTHEAFVGLYGLNPLRKAGIPNFAYVYGGFEASPPIIHPDSKKILAWGTNENVPDQVFYTIFENTNFTETLNDSCKNDTYDIILSYFIQIVLALKSANEYCNFTHYNLHTKNILLRKQVNSILDIEYPFQDKKLLIRSPRGIIATIYEYTTSYIEINVDNKLKGFGYNNYEDVPFDSVGIYNDKSFIMTDVYKLLMHILGTTFLENKTAFNNLKGLYSFFSNEPAEEAIKLQKETFLHLPYYDKTKSFKIDDFILFMLKKYDSTGIVLKKPSSSSITLKTTGTCFEKDPKFTKLTKKSEFFCIPRTTIQLYDYIKYFASLYSETKEAKYLDMINKTAENFEKEFTDDVNEIEQQRLDSISTTLSSRFILQELPYNMNILKKEDFLISYMEFLSKAIFYINTWERLKTGIKVLEFIEKGGSMFKPLYQSYLEIQTKNKSFYEAIRLNLLRYYTFFSCYNLQVENYSSILEGITREKHFEMIREVLKDSDFKWYFLVSNFLKSLWV